MNDEIKEILDYLKNDNYFTESPEYEVSPYDLYKSLNSVQTDKLLDYITNLQEEKDDYKSRNEKAIEYCNKEIENIIANFDYTDTKDLENVRNILKGSDKE